MSGLVKSEVMCFNELRNKSNRKVVKKSLLQTFIFMDGWVKPTSSNKVQKQSSIFCTFSKSNTSMFSLFQIFAGHAEEQVNLEEKKKVLHPETGMIF